MVFVLKCLELFIPVGERSGAVIFEVVILEVSSEPWSGYLIATCITTNSEAFNKGQILRC
jgi:hypothetical protein